jgi:hypothetical protein
MGVNNDDLRRGPKGAVDPKPTPYRVVTRSLGIRPGFNLDKALALAAQLEDEEFIRKRARDSA